MNETALTRTISPEEIFSSVGERLDFFLAGFLQRSRSHAQSLIKQGRVEIHPARSKVSASYRLHDGDTVKVSPMEEQPLEEQPAGEAIPLEIIFEDDALLAINKQPGLVVHPGAGNWTGTLVNALVHHRGEHLAGRGGTHRLGIVHRLDKDTSGVMLIAKTDEVHEKLALAFADRDVKKFYRALCVGTFRRRTGELRGSIDRHAVHRKKMTVTKDPARGRAAWTDYRVMQQDKYGAEVECLLHTGRTHQIRVHLSHLGHPIWGDLLYGKRAPLGEFYPERQMLHAARIEIAHPLTGEPLHLEARLPVDYEESRKRLIG